MTSHPGSLEKLPSDAGGNTIGDSTSMRYIFPSVLIFAAVLARPVSAEEIAGIGAALAEKDGAIVVNALLPDSPAERSGVLHPGDVIVAVGNENDPPVKVKGKKLTEVVQLIRGAKGTRVRLTIIPAGEKDSDAKTITLIRGDLNVKLLRGGDGARLSSETVAPNIEMTLLPEKKIERLADHRGKVVVLEFWATWCGPCQKHLEETQKLVAEHPEWGGKAVFIAASADDDAELAIAHLTKKNWDKTRNVWIGDEVMEQFHVSALPTTYVIDPQGKVVNWDEEKEGVEEVVTRLLKE